MQNVEQIQSDVIRNLCDLLIEASEKRAWLRLGKEYEAADTVKAWMLNIPGILTIKDLNNENHYQWKCSEYGNTITEWRVNVCKK